MSRSSPMIFLAIFSIASIVSLILVVSPYVFTSQDTGALVMSASLSPTNVRGNQTVTLTISERNTLRYPDVLPLTDTLRSENLSSEPCGGLFPFGMGVFQGHDNQANLSSARPVDVFDLFGVYMCPAELVSNSFTFQPQQNVTRQASFNGYWTAGETQHPGGGVSEGVLHPFLPGEYTVLVGDEWGHTELLYFQVAP
ncbi:MAG TPA: hypothetical protein VLX56_00185 [Nitrososphaerales archaeon]|nr:hypothetical protein [Nitrososphaerales archaeon]